ncbi:hypothetical protein [Niabella beijingensis]|uniref:hypothetical protein n=1 Tax=Niabella beijingensis TaxID=2872700 RepID=UPI001CBE137E|nr:hypothetical protein [Niabella beijingensis]MBZ4192179.1 hypothetical protein [Niabella beijingensis]
MKKSLFLLFILTAVTAGYGQSATTLYPAAHADTIAPLKITDPAVAIRVNSAFAAESALQKPAMPVPSFYYNQRQRFTGDTISLKKLKRQLATQKALKGFGVFNIVWGGAWFGAATTLTLMSSENRLLGIIPAAIGAGACVMGIRRVKITRRKIRDLREEINIRAGANTVAFTYSF